MKILYFEGLRRFSLYAPGELSIIKMLDKSDDMMRKSLVNPNMSTLQC